MYLAVCHLASWLTVLSLLSAAAGAETPTSDGYYSKKAVALWDQLAGKQTPITVQSPDGSSQVVARYVENARDYRVNLSVRGRIGALTVNIGPGVGSELLWASDSRSFFVTTSDQGANGLYRLILVGRFGDELQSKDVTPLIYSAFGHPVRCGWPFLVAIRPCSCRGRSCSPLKLRQLRNI